MVVGDEEGQGKQLSRHRAVSVLFGVENYRKQQGHGPAFMALVSERSPFAPLLLQALAQEQLRHANKEYCYCRTNAPLGAGHLPPGHRTEATGTFPRLTPKSPQCDMQARSLQLQFPEPAPQRQRVRLSSFLSSPLKREQLLKIHPTPPPPPYLDRLFPLSLSREKLLQL